ncbi:ATP-binding protein [Vreelandella neptunia]|uniref:HD domain-containing protein n=1 Tax=Vreelandella neptunia TaxID=115551 RepID=UPI00315A6185
MQRFPKRLEEILKDNQQLNGAVLSSVHSFYAWLCDNKTPFFPEYTDHSLVHLNEVLFSADSIISDSSWSQITPEDAAALIISVLLHDCAMHLSEDGFYQLIAGDYPNLKSNYVAFNYRWETLWLDFMSEAKRFDGNKLFQLFGDDRPVRNIPENKIDLTMRDRLLIGEFLRRHHARLAHEISLSGVPGSGVDRLKLIGFDEKYLDLFGFIARSHNMDLRESVDFLDFSKRRVHYNVHVPFVMLLLRIADFIQIHSERAPNNLLKIKGLLSPISRGEWGKHNSIEDINNASEDPEALYVEANPQSAYDFEGLKRLFTDIQKELDKSWAVLGEVYGRVEGLSLLGIKIRRIRSNLDDVNKFIEKKQPSYIPKLLKMKTADSEMMELLIAPLYGNDPSIGIRELVQNSVDACLELKDLEDQGLLRERKSNCNGIVIKIIKGDEEGGKFVIEDYGVGMNIEIVEKYFLNIGASFRNSDLWKKNHENEGKSNIYRTGRFGIGLLASYLLGNSIRVTTRRVNDYEKNGLVFECKKGEPIEVMNCSFRYGTKIEISINKDTVDELVANKRNWDWFCLKEPSVTRFIVDEEETLLDQSVLVPDGDVLKNDNAWNRIEVNGFEDVIWSYTKLSFRKVKGAEVYGPRKDYGLVCNGIFVSASWNGMSGGYKSSRLNISSNSGYYSAEMPTVVVFDQDGRLPLNLERTGLTGENPFLNELRQSISLKFVESIVDNFKNVEKVYSKDVVNKLLNNKEHYINSSSGQIGFISYLAICKAGLFPIDFNLIKDAEIPCIFVESANIKGGLWSSDEFVKNGAPYLPVKSNLQSDSAQVSFLRECLGASNSYSSYYSGLFNNFPVVGRKLLIRKLDAERLFVVGKVPKFIWVQFETEWEDEKWILLNAGGGQKLNMNLSSICDHLDASGSFGFSVAYFDWNENGLERGKSDFYKAWLNTVKKKYL